MTNKTIKARFVAEKSHPKQHDFIDGKIYTFKEHDTLHVYCMDELGWDHVMSKPNSHESEIKTSYATFEIINEEQKNTKDETIMNNKTIKARFVAEKSDPTLHDFIDGKTYCFEECHDCNGVVTTRDELGMDFYALKPEPSQNEIDTEYAHFEIINEDPEVNKVVDGVVEVTRKHGLKYYANGFEVDEFEFVELIELKQRCKNDGISFFVDLEVTFE